MTPTAILERTLTSTSLSKTSGHKLPRTLPGFGLPWPSVGCFRMRTSHTPTRIAALGALTLSTWPGTSRPLTFQRRNHGHPASSSPTFPAQSTQDASSFPPI
eukprot:9979665-Heterocapsa_arctica.AAC.1